MCPYLNIYYIIRCMLWRWWWWWQGVNSCCRHSTCHHGPPYFQYFLHGSPNVLLFGPSHQHQRRPNRIGAIITCYCRVCLCRFWRTWRPRERFPAPGGVPSLAAVVAVAVVVVAGRQSGSGGRSPLSPLNTAENQSVALDMARPVISLCLPAVGCPSHYLLCS